MGEGPFCIRSDGDWHRRGSETYVMMFCLESDQFSRQFVIKACIAGLAPEVTLQNWLERRRLLEGYGVHTPKLYASNEGALLEEFVPDSFVEAYVRLYPKVEKLMQGLAGVVIALTQGRFHILQLLSDLRCSENGDVYMIDFGQDLGTPNGGTSNAANIVLSELNQLPMPLPENLRQEFTRLISTTISKELKMVERSLILLKPDAVEKKLSGQILTMLEGIGTIVAMKMVKPNRSHLEQHYAKENDWFEFVGKSTLEDYSKSRLDPVTVFGTTVPFEVGKAVWNRLIDFMDSGPVVALILEGDDIVKRTRKLVGHTIPAKAEPDTIRGKFGVDASLSEEEQKRSVKNLIHASGNLHEAEVEIQLWFPEIR